MALALVAAATSCRKSETFFQRDVDVVNVTCMAQSVTHYVRSSGAWTSDCSEVDWITLSPASGQGKGSDFEEYKINVAYNPGADREGTFYLVKDGQRCPVTVYQSECTFKVNTSGAKIEGALVQNETSSAVIAIPFVDASGEEMVDVQVELGGKSAGLSVVNGPKPTTAGKGNIIVTIDGVPAQAGELTLKVTAAGASKDLKTTIQAGSSPDVPQTGVIAAWAFCKYQGSTPESDEIKARYPEWTTDSHMLKASAGVGEIVIAEAAGKTTPAVNSFGYNNGHAYIKGLYVNDSWQMNVPVTNIAKNSDVTVAGSFGGSGSAAAFFLAEYSVDGTSWTEVPGASTGTYAGKDVRFHAQAKDSYDEAEGAFRCTFKMPVALKDAELRIRLRVSADVRVTLASAITTGGSGSNRLKGDWTVTVEEGGEQPITGDPEGLPVGWNFYAAGCTNLDECSANPAGKDWVAEPHLVYPTTGNAKATLTGIGAAIGGYSFNPSMQIRGFVADDYWLVTIPVKNFEKGTKVTVEMGCGAAGSGAGVFVLEYSDDKATWHLADGLATTLRGETEVQAHLWTTPGSISMSGYTNTRKSYDKATDDTYRKFDVSLNNVRIADGNLYFRLRALNYRATPTVSTAPGANAWTDLKGFEVSLAK